jgi:hypothetical protein
LGEGIGRCQKLWVWGRGGLCGAKSWGWVGGVCGKYGWVGQLGVVCWLCECVCQRSQGREGTAMVFLEN